jgi:hypothetical protein
MSLTRRSFVESALGLAAAATAGDRHVLPGNALRFEILLEDFKRRCFAAGSPPVQDFDAVVCTRGRGRNRHCGGSGENRQFQKFH